MSCRPLFMTARAAAQTSIYCSVAKELDAVSGKYFRRCRISRESSLACDPRLAAQLWHVCCFVVCGTYKCYCGRPWVYMEGAWKVIVFCHAKAEEANWKLGGPNSGIFFLLAPLFFWTLHFNFRREIKHVIYCSAFLSSLSEYFLLSTPCPEKKVPLYFCL